MFISVTTIRVFRLGPLLGLRGDAGRDALVLRRPQLAARGRRHEVRDPLVLEEPLRLHRHGARRADALAFPAPVAAAVARQGPRRAGEGDLKIIIYKSDNNHNTNSMNTTTATTTTTTTTTIYYYYYYYYYYYKYYYYYYFCY